MNKNTLTVSGAMILVAVVGVALAFSNGPRISDDITIGILVPLTGKSASIGERVKAGIEAGLAEIEATDGYRLRVVYEDDKGEATSAVSATQKLITTDGVRIIIGTVKSDAMLAVAPITEQNKVILLSPTAGAEAISQAGDFVFRVIETPDIHGKASATYLAGKKVALFTANAANAQSYGKFFKSNFTETGGTLVSETAYNQDESDFHTEIAKAIQNEADAFYLAVATAKDAGVLTRQIREAGFGGIIMASIAADAKEFFDTAGPSGEGTVLTASYFDNTSTAGAEFNTQFRKITGNEGNGFSANGYDAIMLINDALKKCAENTECVRDFLYATKNYQGAGGTLSFDAHGDVVKPVSIKVARDGAFVVEK